MRTGRAFADQGFQVLLLRGRGLFREVPLEGDGFAAQLGAVDFALTAAAEEGFDRAGMAGSGLNRGTELQELVHGGIPRNFMRIFGCWATFALVLVGGLDSRFHIDLD